MDFNKKHIVCLLFIGAFIYALSPSVCNIYVNNAFTRLSLPNSPAGEFAKLGTATQPEKNSRGIDIVVHKARTLVPEDGIAKLPLLKNMPVSDGRFSLFDLQPAFYFGNSLCAKVPANGFRLLCSGLSPPAV